MTRRGITCTPGLQESSSFESGAPRWLNSGCLIHGAYHEEPYNEF